MDPIENIINHVALLFWFVNERNWTIQSTSTIVKPRKDGDEYKPGEIVIARYSGKKYYAVIISVNDQREKLHDVKVKFDDLLKDASLSKKEVLQKMGIEADLTSYKADPASLAPSASSEEAGTKRDHGEKVAPVKAKKAKPALSSKAKEQKEESLAAERQKKAVSLESSKLMASRMIEKMFPGGSVGESTPHALPNKSPEKDRHVQTPTSTMCSVPTQEATKSTPISFNNSQVINSIQQQTFPCSPSTSQVPTPQATTATPLSPSYTQVISSPQQQALPFQHGYQYQPISNNQSYTPNQNTDNTYTPYWNAYGNGSASEFLANSFTQDIPSTTMECSKCMVRIQSLEERVKALENQVQSLVSSRQHTTQTHTYTPHNTHSSQSYPAQEPCSQPLSVPVSETGVAAAANASLESQTDGQVELVPGYGVMVSVPQIDACLRKAKTSGTALARLLCMVLFDDETLANSCARGTKTKPALDRRKVDAIIKYVGEKRSMSEPEVVQAINQKCSDIRRSRTVKPILAKK